METKKSNNSEAKRGLKCYKEDIAKRITYSLLLHCGAQ